MEDELVTIKTFFYDHETLLYEPRFRSADIFYHLKDQKTVAIDPLVSNSIGGIKLQVRKSDVERAMKIVDEINELETLITVNGVKYERVYWYCPNCDSEQVFKEIFSFFESALRSFSKMKHYCKGCGHKWKE